MLYSQDAVHATVPTPPRDGFSGQAFVVWATTSLTYALATVAMNSILDGASWRGSGLLRGLAGWPIVWLYASIFGLLPSLLSTAALRSWGRVVRTPPIAIAALFSLSLLAGVGAVWVPEALHSGGTVERAQQLWPLPLAVGALCGILAGIVTRRLGPAMMGLVAGAGASLPLVFLAVGDANDLLRALLALCAASFAGATAYGLVEGRRSASPRASMS
jgi:hypothetical protein